MIEINVNWSEKMLDADETKALVHDWIMRVSNPFPLAFFLLR